MNRGMWQNSQLHAIIGKLKIDKETKEELVYQFSGGRSKSSKDLLFDECQHLINYLNAVQKGTTQLKARTSGAVYDACNQMRRKILSICHELQWEKADGKIDWPRLNNYLNKYGYLHKPLNDYIYEELPKLVTQFENLLRDAVRKV